MLGTYIICRNPGNLQTNRVYAPLYNHVSVCVLNTILRVCCQIWACLGMSIFLCALLFKCHLWLGLASLSLSPPHQGYYRVGYTSDQQSLMGGIGRDVDVMIVYFWGYALFDRSVCLNIRPVTQRFLFFLSPQTSSESKKKSVWSSLPAWKKFNQSVWRNWKPVSTTV